MATVRLYHHDSFARRFEARVLDHGRLGDRPTVVLDQTALYPEAGGQMADRGTLTVDGATQAVSDVQVDDAGTIHHVVEGAAPALGATVVGEVAWARRRVHMALHTGQHLLSRALIEAAGAPTVSSRLGETDCTIDVTRPEVPERELAAAEALANQIIDDDVVVRAWFPEPDELATLPLRREPKVEREVRVIAIGDFDCSPCGGTHVARSAQIGAIHVVGTERYKGMTRVYFAAGGRGRALTSGHSAALTALGRELSCGPADVAAAVDKLRRALADARADADAVRTRLAAALAATLAPTPSPAPVVTTVDDAALLRPLAAAVTAAGRDALLACPGADGLQVLVARADGSARDCGALLKRLAGATGGRGGGKPTHAEGRLPSGTDWPAVVAAALA
ncbi:MAG: alanyl-tRNA editing protein [Kofleriaceae bacterium]